MNTNDPANIQPLCGQSPPNADNMRTKPPAYGEPWMPLQPDLIYDNGSHWMADAYNPQVRDRIITCVNACAGMADPAAEIKAMRDAAQIVKDLAEWSARYPRGMIYSASNGKMDDELVELEKRATATLAKLQPFTTQGE